MSLSKKKDVDVIVNLSPRALPRNGFNIGLIIGKTDVIDADTRIKGYSSPEEMLEDGFALTDPLYLGAVEYFAQNGNLGASLSTLYIGAVTTTSEEGVEPVTYEDYDDVLVDCRAKNSDWYGFTTCEEMDDADCIALARETESFETPTVYMCVTSALTSKAGEEGSLLDVLYQTKYDRTIATWHENALFGCGLLGYAMGANTGLINSAYSLKFKQITGMEASDLNTTNVTNIENLYGNCYVRRADAQYEQGTCSSGTWFDEIINLDKLCNDIQLNVYDLLYSLPKEPQTEAGHADIAGVISQACEQARKIGFLGEGLKWRRPSVLALSKGDVLPNGYLIQWEDVNEQTDADRDARKSQPFYVCVNLAGAIHSVVIQVNVSR